MDGLLIILAFLVILFVALALKRSLRGRKGSPFSTLPWYLGGPREIEFPHPPNERKSARH